MNLNNLKKLIKGYDEGTLTPDEFEELEAWFHSLNYKHTDVQGSLSNSEFEDRLFQTFKQKLQVDKDTSDETKYQPAIIAADNRFNYGRWLAIAASVIIVLGVFFFKYAYNTDKQKPLAAANTAPGSNKALLTLSNGANILLDKLPNGYQKTEQGYKIIKHKDKVIYEATTSTSNNTNTVTTKWNTITTPKGGEFEVKLPDGSTVLLNAKSSLRFPLTFNKQGREVFLTGEAYFEVAKLKTKDNKRIPFRVISENQSVEVLGTHFNINAYQNQGSIKTTLLEGSVKVTDIQDRKKLNSVLLVPGQQATFSTVNNMQAAITVARANLDETMAWKSGRFMFNNRDLKFIMQQLERWYDITVDYNNLPNKKFNGDIPRSLALSKVLMALEKTSGYRFKIATTKTADGAVERRLVMDR